ncbi:archease [Candidatus Pacearchaeota archaeon]|nr:archease [Candidatus Pacearchaeota archaeon]
MGKINMKQKTFEFLEHTGDVKFKANGENAEDLFNHCALALSHLFSRGKKIAQSARQEFSVSGEDYEALLYNFLDELIYLFDAKQFVVSKTEVTLEKGEEYTLNVVAYGDNTKKYKDLDAVKAPTYAEMYFKQLSENEWEAQVVVDV